MGLHAFLLQGLRLTLQHQGDQALLHHNQGTPSPQFARPPEALQRPNCKQRALRYLKDALGQHCYHRHSADLPKLPAFHQTQWQQRTYWMRQRGWCLAADSWHPCYPLQTPVHPKWWRVHPCVTQRMNIATRQFLKRTRAHLGQLDSPLQSLDSPRSQLFHHPTQQRRLWLILKCSWHLSAHDL